MKRDMDLVRKLLLYVEQNHTYDDLHSPGIEIPGYSPEQIGYHLNIMADGDLIDVSDATAMGDDTYYFAITGITWSGHDFLDSVRDDNVWNHTKEKLKPVASASFEVFKSVAVAYIKSLVAPSP